MWYLAHTTYGGIKSFLNVKKSTNLSCDLPNRQIYITLITQRAECSIIDAIGRCVRVNYD